MVCPRIWTPNIGFSSIFETTCRIWEVTYFSFIFHVLPYALLTNRVINIMPVVCLLNSISEEELADHSVRCG